jgi:hypothetical protein
VSSLGLACDYREIVTPGMDERDTIICEGIDSQSGAEKWVADTLAKIDSSATDL